MVSQGGVHQKSDRVCFVDRKNIKKRIKKSTCYRCFLNEYFNGIVSAS